jgi:hypothetical protein
MGTIDTSTQSSRAPARPGTRPDGRRPVAPSGLAVDPDNPPLPPLSEVVVDDDEWRRRGVVDGNRDLGGVLRVSGARPRSEANALVATAPDVVVLAVDTDGWDRFGGLRTAGRLRPLFGPDTCFVALVEDPGNPLLPVRAGEARINHLYPSAEVRDLVSLEGLLLAPRASRRPAHMADLSLLRRMGVQFQSRFSAGLELIEQRGLTALFDEHPVARLSRRRTITLRRELASTMAVRPVGPVTAALNQPVLPTWQQLRRLVDMARGLPVAPVSDPRSP